jgi:hypothetical protein
MFRLLDSQWLEDATLGSELLNVTSQDVAVLVLTLNVVLFVVSVAEESVPVSVFEYSWLLTSEPAAHPLPVKSCADSVPLSGAPLADETIAVSLGSQSWSEVAHAVLVNGGAR